MAIKKSDLYSSLWASCDELRGGMDASQYKDYVLFMLFIKYVSDKYADFDGMQPPVVIPPGAGFRDMVALKGKPDIGDKINTQVIQKLVDANTRLSRHDFPDFNDPNRLGEGNELIHRLTNLVAIFEKPELDFSSNRADNDDILGDAYEYLMRHFASESGKSKGQFYTPSEVSRIMAQVIGIGPHNTTARTTAYDPTCGSGSLLLKLAAEAGNPITLEGQEKDVTTAGLARMNMILHDFPTALVLSGNTLADPKFKDGERLRTYDYVVANPPFSDKAWSTGLTPSADPYQRFQWGEPPGKQGDYAYLLHIIRSMKSTSGKGACILPHGVLFRGNAEAVIRKQLIRSGTLKGIIGLPANLFYGTGIPACILVLDKENATARKGIFMIDASKGFMKDGNKNRLRERDLHQIVDVFTHAKEDPGFSRLVPHDEIADPKNDFNLNLPRYIDTREAEDKQDIDAHLNGGIPTRDIKALNDYWQVCPDLRSSLFTDQRPGYCELAVAKADLKRAIHQHPQFAAFIAGMNTHFIAWRDTAATDLKTLQTDCLPKQIIHQHSESLLAHYEEKPLLDAYAVYQHLTDYWAETMQDDCYLIAAIDAQQAELETIAAQLTELEEEHGGEEGAFADLDKITQATVTAELKKSAQPADGPGTAELPLGPSGKEAEPELGAPSDTTILRTWLKLTHRVTKLKRAIKAAEAALDQLALDQYPKLSKDEVRTLVVDDKWLATLETAIHGEMDRISQALTQRVAELADRYDTPLKQMTDRVSEMEAKVNAHLERMGFSWN